MTQRERFLAALDRRPITGRVPHFELVFFLTMEAFGKVHPNHRHYRQWDQMSEKERGLHREDIADVFIMTAERFEHSAIYLHANPGTLEEQLRLLNIMRDKSGDTYGLFLPGDATYAIPNGENMVEWAVRMAEEPEALKDEAARKVDRAILRAERIAEHGGCDGFCMCADYCFNDGPFLRPERFAEFVTPYLKKLIESYRDLGFHTIKHTDGDIMPILDQLVDCGPHALHSLDPQAGIDMADMKRRIGDKVCLIGNVNCGLLNSGTDEECAESAGYALRHGMPGGGYIFSTSNCIYTGMALERYELILDVWRRAGNYAGNDE